MKRGELYLVSHPTSRDPKKRRVYVIVSRQVLIDSRYSSVVCAPVYSTYHGLSTQVPVGTGEGLKRDCSIHCDDLVSLPKSVLTNYIGALAPAKLMELGRALRAALDLPV
jgi:mRNA interferase MazF